MENSTVSSWSVDAMLLGPNVFYELAKFEVNVKSRRLAQSKSDIKSAVMLVSLSLMLKSHLFEAPLELQAPKSYHAAPLSLP